MCYIFTIFFMLTFSYARVSLGMALYFFGLSYLIIREGNIVKRLIIIVCSFLLAYMAHRSMLLPIIIAPLSLLKLTKRKIILIACLSPFIIVVIKYALSTIVLDILAGSSSEFAKSTQGYISSRITVKFNWKWELITTLRYWSFYIALLYALWIFFFKRSIENHSTEIRSLLTITLFIEIIAVAILIIGGNELQGLWVIGYRYLYMAGIPLCLILTHMYQNRLLSNKNLNRILLFPLLYAELFILGKIITIQFIN